MSMPLRDPVETGDTTEEMEAMESLILLRMVLRMESTSWVISPVCTWLGGLQRRTAAPECGLQVFGS